MELDDKVGSRGGRSRANAIRGTRRTALPTGRPGRGYSGRTGTLEDGRLVRPSYVAAVAWTGAAGPIMYAEAHEGARLWFPPGGSAVREGGDRVGRRRGSSAKEGRAGTSRTAYSAMAAANVTDGNRGEAGGQKG